MDRILTALALISIAAVAISTIVAVRLMRRIRALRAERADDDACDAAALRLAAETRHTFPLTSSRDDRANPGGAANSRRNSAAGTPSRLPR